MSLLAPLYALGALAIIAPIVFHLIRRSPRGEVPFSSLMFLSPTPPRLTRRSRLDHWLLLLLRAAALGLLAVAFARPFVREALHLDLGDIERQRTAVLIDTSASLRRADLWPRAKALAAEVFASARPADQVALFAFDATTRPLLGFEESATLDSARRRAVAKAQLDRLAPSWATTNLGQALIDTVTAIEDVADASEKSGRMPRRVVLISDLQQGSRIAALGDFEWPSDVELELKTVADHGSNAGLEALAEPIGSEAAPPNAPVRVRISNDPSSRQESFQLSWVGANGAPIGKAVNVYVPPGESRVARVPKPSEPLRQRSLRLTGDACAFDNTIYFADESREEATILYVGKDAADDPTGLRYYLERVFADTPRRTIHIRAVAPSANLAWEAERVLPLIVVGGEASAEPAAGLQKYVRGGGTVLYVATTAGPAETLAKVADVAPFAVEEADVVRDVMLGEIAFDHPLFAPLAGAQFNDFTKIHFWKYRRIPPKALSDARVLARFETGDPAFVERVLGKGRVVVLASSWRPVDGQLARSSKFVPLMASLAEGRDPLPLVSTNLRVNDRVPLPPSAEDSAKGLLVLKPDGASVNIKPGTAFFSETDQPGLYTIEGSGGARSFAVNLDPSESRTSPLQIETLEQFGCRLANPTRKALDREHLRQMQNAELENRQKLWRWLIVAALGILIVETLLAGRLKQPRPSRAEVATP